MKKISLLIATILLAVNIGYSQPSKVSTAITHLTNGDYKQAKEAIDIAVLNEKTMDQAKTWYYKGRIYQEIGKDQTGLFNILSPNGLDTAMSSYKTALSMADVSKIKKDIFDQLQLIQLDFFNKGAQSYSAQNFVEAYNGFSKSAEANSIQFDIDPKKSLLDTGAIFNAGLCAEKINKMDDALSLFQRLADMQYHEPYIYQKLSAIYQESGNNDLALKAIEAGRGIMPNDEALILEELNFYLKQGKMTEILDKLKEAIKLDPNNAELYFALGNTNGQYMEVDTLNAAKYFDEASKAYLSAIEIKPDYFDAYLNLGALYYNSAIKINQIMNALPLSEEAKYTNYEKERNTLYVKALPYFEKALTLDKTNSALILSMKEIYVRTGNMEKSNEMKKLLGE